MKSSDDECSMRFNSVGIFSKTERDYCWYPLTMRSAAAVANGRGVLEVADNIDGLWLPSSFVLIFNGDRAQKREKGCGREIFSVVLPP
ncbi:hypothetical protein NL676_023929 [Syzygium grande]|nr:hypothetical protein NL676_023929 [Syzygium grande]